MIKRGLLGILVFFVLLNLVMANEICSPDIKLINQDPYPAIPGDYVKLVFQVTGIENPNCGKVSVSLKENFPFSLDPNENKTTTIDSGIFVRTFSSFLIVPYKVRVDENAVDGENPIEVQVSPPNTLSSFNVSIKDYRSDFEVFVKDYNPLTKIMTLEILNIGKNDIKALTLEIPKQENIQVKGADRNILGDLDSNDYTTADFEVASAKGNININVHYTDTINIRRVVQTTFNFDPEAFSNRAGTNNKTSPIVYIIIIAIVILVSYWIIKKIKKNHKKN